MTSWTNSTQDAAWPKKSFEFTSNNSELSILLYSSRHGRQFLAFHYRRPRNSRIQFSGKAHGMPFCVYGTFSLTESSRHPVYNCTKKKWRCSSRQCLSDLGTELDRISQNGFQAFSGANKNLNRIHIISGNLAQPGGSVSIFTPDCVKYMRFLLRNE